MVTDFHGLLFIWGGLYAIAVGILIGNFAYLTGGKENGKTF